MPQQVPERWASRAADQKARVITPQITPSKTTSARSQTWVLSDAYGSTIGTSPAEAGCRCNSEHSLPL